MATDATRLLKIVITGDAKAALGAFKETEVGTDSLLGKLGGLGTVLPVAAVAAGAVAIGTALFKIGDDFDKAYDQIRAGTGATGAQLDGLKDEFKQVVADVPTDFGKAADAVTVITQKLGESGPAAKTLAEQFLEVSRITKTDLTANLEGGTSALNAWGIQAAQQGDALDELFRITQQTGVSFGDLTSQLAAAQPVFSAAGLGFEESASLVGLLGKNGLSASDVLPALSKSLATAAKEGKNAAQVFGSTFEAIKNAPDDVTAAGDALQVFGAKAGPKFAALIREGKLNYDDFMDSILSGKDTILGAGKETQDFGEKWELLKNRVLVALEPIAMRVFDAIGKAMDKLGPIVEKLSVAFGQNGFAGVVKLVAQAFDNLDPKTKLIIAGIAALGIALAAVVAPVAVIIASLAAIGVALVYAYNNFEGFRNGVNVVITDVTAIINDFVTVAMFLWDTLGKQILADLQAVWPYVEQVIQGAMQFIQGVIDVFTGLIHGDWSQAWQGIQEIFTGVWNVITGSLGASLALIQSEITNALSIIQDAWSQVWNAIAAALQWVWDHTIGPVVDQIQNALGVAQSAWDTISSIAGTVGVGTTDFGKRAAQHVGQNAGGTTFWGGGQTWVGERGPELVDLPMGSRVIPNDQAMSFSQPNGDVNISLVVNAGMGTDGQQVGQQIIAALEEAARRGGTFGVRTKAALSA